jgi:hypothetical protein
VALDVAAEADAVTADLRALAPELTVVPVIRTGRPFSGDPHPWTRRVALVACTRLARVDGAAGRWPRVAGLLLELATDREAALPKAGSWVLRSWLGPCPEEVAAFVDRHAGQLPAVAVRETRAKLATGTKRPPRRPGRPRPAPAEGSRPAPAAGSRPAPARGLA